MIFITICLILAPFVYGQPRPISGTAHLRVSETERFFYSGLDHRIVIGWSDDRSSNLQSAYGVVLLPAQNLAQLNFSARGIWRIEARERGYQAKEEDEIIFRIRAGDGEQGRLTFFAGPAEGNELVQHEINVNPQWHQERISMRDLGKPSEIRVVGLRNESPNRIGVYVAYMYLKINPRAEPKQPKTN